MISLETLSRGRLTPQRRAALTELVSFLAVGGLGAVSFVVVSTVAIAVFTQYPPWVVSACCYAAHIVPVYLLHRRFAFRSATSAHTRALPRYVAVQLLGIALAASLSWVAYGIPGLPNIAAALLVTGLTSALNFVILRVWAFSNA